MNARQLARLIGEQNPEKVLQALNTLKDISRLNNVATAVDLILLRSIFYSDPAIGEKKEPRLSPSQRQILNILEEKGELTYEDLADESGLHPNTALHAANALVKKGFA